MTLFFNDSKDYKNVASGLRRELKAFGCPAVSHTQMVEALARSLGHASWAALQAAQERRKPSAVEPVPVSKQTQDEPVQCSYRLLNTDGQLDLTTDDGDFVTGLWLRKLEGTMDTIPGTASVNSVRRDENGELRLGGGGETDVDWDGQRQRTDARGEPLWWSEAGEEVAQDHCIVVPEGLDGEGFLEPEIVDEYELPVRDVLVDAVFRWLCDNEHVVAALAEMPSDESWAGEAHPHNFFVHNATAFQGTKKRKASVLGSAQRTVGFALHVGEFKALRKQLREHQAPELF